MCSDPGFVATAGSEAAMAVARGVLSACALVSVILSSLPFCRGFSVINGSADALRSNDTLTCASVTETSSLTYVVDTTGSMSDDLQQLKLVNDWLLDRVTARFPCGVRKYTMVEFNDPGFGPSYATNSKTQFSNFFKNLTANGGDDCPELAMMGLKLGLETSPSNSFILVLTDASAKDAYNTTLINDIYSLIASKRSQIFFLITGLCAGVDDPQFQIYRNISLRSFGHVFQVSLADLGKAFYYLDFTLSRPSNSSTPLFSGDYSVAGNYIKTFQVPQQYPALTLTTDGAITSLRLVSPNGREAELKRIISEVWGSMYQVKNAAVGVWTLGVNATGAHGIRVEGFTGTNNTSTTTRCSDCHINATCEDYITFQECTCKDGFIGNGFNCSDVDECAYSWSNNCTNGFCINTFGSYSCRCNAGYVLDPGNICRDINECTRPDLNRCHPQATCINYLGFYSCICQNGYYGDGYSCELNQCNAYSCGPANDCLKTPGSFSCFDPCSNHTVLNEPWRSTSFASGSLSLNCDMDKRGWYRFIGSGGVRMPETCVPELRCNTHAPMWINGTHPTDDKIVSRTACAAWSGSCCLWSTTVQIKLCPGRYYVYNITSTPNCHLTYCTDPTYVDNPCACSADEECRLVNGTWGCYCKNGAPITDISSLRPQLKCGKTDFGASFRMCQLENLGFNTSNIWLRDRSCAGFLEKNVSSLLTFVHPLRAGQCGTQLMTNETHATYTNMLHLSARSDLVITRDKEVNISYSCTYPLDLKLSLLTVLRPMASTLNINFGDTGEFKLKMALYRDINYLSPYEGPEVILAMSSLLYVGIMLDGGDTTQYNVLMRNCYATPSGNATDPIRYYIIKDSCPNKQDVTIQVAENGVSAVGRFSVQMFKFVGNYNLVYLHCEVHLCDVRKAPCVPSCSRARSAVNSDDESVHKMTVGPCRRSDPPSSANSNGKCSYWPLWIVAMVTLGRQISL